MQAQPPKWARRFLAWYCKPHLLEDIEGDLHEQFVERVAAEGERAARRQYAWDVIRYLRPHTVRRQDPMLTTSPGTDMLRNYWIISLRNLWRNRLCTALNVAGLAIGISACLVIYLIVHFELNHDTFHPDGERIYRVYTRYKEGDKGTNRGVTAALPLALRAEVTGIETVAPFHTLHNASVRAPRGTAMAVFREKHDVILAEAGYFKVFSAYRWLAGSPETSLRAPFQVVLTESKARVYFGLPRPEAAVGRTLHYNDSLAVTVSGIVQDLPGPTDLYFSDFISYSTIGQSWLKKNSNLDDWGSIVGSSQVFVKLLPGVQPAQVEAQLPALPRKHAGPETGAHGHRYPLQALADLHFDPRLGIFNDSRAAAHRPTLRILTGVCGLLLLVAVINFVNLVTAQAVRRAKEVGVRKVLGSTRGELIGQFLSESLLVTLAAVLLATLLSVLALRYFREFIPGGVALDLTHPATLLFLLTTTVGVSLLAGLYPSFVLSAFAPVVALKNAAGAVKGGGKGAFVRRGLIVFQFSFAQVLIVGTFVIGSQLDFMLGKDLGFDQGAVVYFEVPSQGKDQRLVLKEELARLPGVAALSQHDLPPAHQHWSMGGAEWHNGKVNIHQEVHRRYADTAYIHLYGIPLVAGRNLLPSDTVREYLINETLARRFGFAHPAEALGKMINKKYPIVGVVRDFHVQSLHNPVAPVVITTAADRLKGFGIKLTTGGAGRQAFAAKIDGLKAVWDRLYPDVPFRYSFLDESIAGLYKAEQRAAKLMRAAMGIALLISCLGLFGLATYSASRRTREIGIRKVLGAPVFHLVGLLSRDFLLLVALAFVIAAPVAWYVMNGWLANFSYRVGVSWWLFAGAGGLAGAIALLTVSFQSIRAALANPVDSLRNE